MVTKRRLAEALVVERADAFFHRERRLQTIGIVLLGLFVAAGAVGVFGDGPLSHVTRREGGVQLKYERFARMTYRTAIGVAVDTTAADGQPVRIRISRDFLQNVGLLEVRPPAAQRGLTEDLTIFEVPASAGKAHLELHYEPENPGRLDAAIQADGSPPARLTQLVYF